MTAPLLKASGLVKVFGHVQALRGAAFDVDPGEIVALVGDNGAGKSTLVKILAGTLQPAEGTVEIDGHAVRISSPHHARELGIETVYQDLALAPDLDPAANLFLGREVVRSGIAGKLGWLDRKAMRSQAEAAFAGLGTGVRATANPVTALSGGQRQAVAVARAATWASRLIFMDEPTAALGVVQSQKVHDLIRRVRDPGTSVVLVSHNLPEVFAIAERIQVLRLGRRVAVFPRHAASFEDVVAAMTGALGAGEGSG